MTCSQSIERSISDRKAIGVLSASFSLAPRILKPFVPGNQTRRAGPPRACAWGWKKPKNQRMGFAVVAWSALAASASLLLSLVGGPAHFSPNACASVSAALPYAIVGQPAALAAIADAVCDHLAETVAAAVAGGGANSKRGGAGGAGGGGGTKPLVLSAHGPPGVGKSAAHAVLAAALYSPADLSSVLEGLSRAEEESELEEEGEGPEEAGEGPRRRGRRKTEPPPLPLLLADCPGKGCPGYRVLFGLDYSDSARSGALSALRESLLEHVAKHPQVRADARERTKFCFILFSF